MMIAARLKWFALLAACWAVTYGINHYRANSVREYMTSAQVYWRAEPAPAATPAAGSKAPAAGRKALPVATRAADSGASSVAQPEAIITLTTATEVRSESLIAEGLRVAAGWAKLTPAQPDRRIGAAHVFTLRDGAWQEQKLSPVASPLAFALWPYNGHFYTWDKRQFVREWNGKFWLPAPPQRTAELRSAFPLDPNNYVAAGKGNPPHPYDIVQDVITRDEWHAYQNVATLPNAKHLLFSAAGKDFEVVSQRSRIATNAGEVSLTVNGGGKPLPLWQAQPEARSVSAAEFVNFRNALPLYPGSVSNPGQGRWLELGAALLTIFVVSMVFLKPMLLNNTKMVVQYVDATPYEFPKLDRDRWDDYTAKLEALGFAQLRDFKMSNAITGGISRMFLHPQSNCYASIHQVFSRNAPPLGLGIFSYLGEDWTVGHGTNMPTPGSALTRTGHKLSFSRPGMSPEQLYAEHIATRDKISNDLCLAIVTPQDFETYRVRSIQATQAMRNSIRKTNPIMILLKHRLAKVKPLSNDWLGDYPKEMEARTGQKFVSAKM